jgi:hypothetical protein
VLWPTWGFYVSQTINLENAHACGQWLERYRNTPNVIWVNSGDRIPVGFERSIDSWR